MKISGGATDCSIVVSHEKSRFSKFMFQCQFHLPVSWTFRSGSDSVGMSTTAELPLPPTVTTLSAVIPMLRHLYLVTLKQLQNTEAYIYNKSAFRYLRTLTTWHCPHSHTAAVATDQYILHAGPTAANLQQQGACGQCQVCCCGPMRGQTYGQTDTIPFHRPCSKYYAGSASNEW